MLGSRVALAAVLMRALELLVESLPAPPPLPGAARLAICASSPESSLSRRRPRASALSGDAGVSGSRSAPLGASMFMFWSNWALPSSGAACICRTCAIDELWRRVGGGEATVNAALG